MLIPLSNLYQLFLYLMAEIQVLMLTLVVANLDSVIGQRLITSASSIPRP